MGSTRRSFLVAAGAAVCGLAQTAEPGFRSLFDGRTLTGWDFDARLWMPQQGAIVGTTQDDQLAHDEFAIAHGRFRNFVFRSEVKLRNHRSGIQFRGETHPEWLVTGLQAAAGQDSLWGSIYDEGGRRGVIVDGWRKAQRVVRLTDWNVYEVACSGDAVQLRLNGVETANFSRMRVRDGVIALALMTGPAMQVSFRNIRIKVLPD